MQLAKQRAIGNNAVFNQGIIQIAQQTSNGVPASQTIVELALQIVVGPSTINQKIIQASQQLSSNRAPKQSIQQVIYQIALQTANEGGDAKQILNQIASQVAQENYGGLVSQAILQLGTTGFG